MSSGRPGAMSPDELKARARRFADELLTQGDLSVARELFTPDCHHHAPEVIGSGDSGIASWVAELRRTFPDLRAIVEDEIAEGDRVTLRLSLAGTQEAPFGDIAPGGQRATWEMITIFYADTHGRFVEAWSSWDRLGFLAQLGSVQLAEDGARAPPPHSGRSIFNDPEPHAP